MLVCVRNARAKKEISRLPFFSSFFRSISLSLSLSIFGPCKWAAHYANILSALTTCLLFTTIFYLNSILAFSSARIEPASRSPANKLVAANLSISYHLPLTNTTSCANLNTVSCCSIGYCWSSCCYRCCCDISLLMRGAASNNMELVSVEQSANNAKKSAMIYF